MIDEITGEENPEKITFKERRLYFLVGSILLFTALLMAAGYPADRIVEMLGALGIGAVIPSPLSKGKD